MAKKRTPRTATGKNKATRRNQSQSLEALNRWFAENHDLVMARARANTLKLIGRPTL